MQSNNEFVKIHIQWKLLNNVALTTITPGIIIISSKLHTLPVGLEAKT